MVHWYALYTKPRKEQKVAQQLEQLGFTVYLPMKTETRQWSDRKKKVVVPLFSSYVFIQIEESKRADVFIIDGILNYVFWLNKPALIRDDEMELMRNTIDQPHHEVFVDTLQQGEMVELQQGVFKGQKALIEQVSNTKMHMYLPSIGVKLIINKNSL